MAKVLITRKSVNIIEELLNEQGYEIDLWEHDSPMPKEEILKRGQDADAIITQLNDPIDRDLINSLPNIKVIANFAVGFNNIDIQAAKEKSIRVGNTPDVLTDSTADMAFALLLNLARRVNESAASVKRGEWNSFKPMNYTGTRLKGKTVGIVGMGRIGSSFAKKCFYAYNMKVLYYNNNESKNAKEINAQKVDFETLLKESDFVSIHAPLTPETENLFNAHAFSLMKPSSIFINTGRGGIHDEEALYQALFKKEIWAAGLDVTNPEPMSADSPLLKLPNVIVTPHIASGDMESRIEMGELCANNVIAALEGRKMPAEVL